MSAHEREWIDVQELYQWPSPFVSSPDILSYLSETGARENGHNLDNPSCEEHPTPAAGGSSQGSNSAVVNQQLMRPPPMCPRPVYENVYCVPLTQNIPRPQWDPYGIGLSLQKPVFPQNGLANYPAENPPLGQGTDDNSLLEELAACPDLDTDPSLVADLLSSEENKIHTNQKPASAHQGSLTLDTSFVNPVFSSPPSLPSSSTTTSLSFSDLSAYSEASFFSPVYTPRSSTTLSSTPLSPAPSPVITRTEAVRGACPARVTPSPRTKKRGTPYTLDGGRNRWSTGSVAPHLTFPNPANRLPFASPSTQNRNLSLSTDLTMTQPDTVNSAVQISQSPQITLPSNFERECHSAFPGSSTSQGRFLTLQNTTGVNNNRYFEHNFELPGPPDLLGPPKEEPLRPPAQDMMPQDPSMMPHEQELRFENDLYTPRWVRGHGIKREGWCGICKPGRWLVLKTSAFWYDKKSTHGICAATGRAFTPPREMRREEGNANIWEGLCGTCARWVRLDSNKKTETAWYKHADKCHQNNRPNETSKRRRGSGVST